MRIRLDESERKMGEIKITTSARSLLHIIKHGKSVSWSFVVGIKKEHGEQ